MNNNTVGAKHCEPLRMGELYEPTKIATDGSLFFIKILILIDFI